MKSGDSATSTMDTDSEVRSDHPDDKLLTKEDVQSWGKSFDNLMQSRNGRKVFREFLRSEDSEGNLLFWLACDDLNQETRGDVIVKKAWLIHDTYLSINTNHQVQLDPELRKLLSKRMRKPTVRMFEEAQAQIYAILCNDFYPRFLTSAYYNKLL